MNNYTMKDQPPQTTSFKLQTVFLLLSFVLFHLSGFAQDPKILVQKLKAKLDKVNDYVANGRMKTYVAFIKAPAGNVKMFYKKP